MAYVHRPDVQPLIFIAKAGITPSTLTMSFKTSTASLANWVLARLPPSGSLKI
ncbi:hypothetical protein GALMADRAFT_257636 [Galerina marginata CBS 339.88]|uniref:Uncharacterized protein n=1 Tax=Galerina marginata (strain CBS 339.88) TaxID=685588 RepID=A0A067SA71_GALM3|nr:hypothetical protein GALMADRAFT_257636 [Galerina marginata CBS 339.88]